MEPLDPPTDEEWLDAILVLEECDPPTIEIDVILVAEANMILKEADD